MEIVAIRGLPCTVSKTSAKRNTVTRVVVIGNAGGGKSTLCRQLSAAQQLPCFSIDQMMWRPGWKPAPRDEFSAMHAAVLERPAWIIDGFGPWQEIEKRMDLADTIILVDHPLWLHYWWATKRQIASFFKWSDDGLDGCPRWAVTVPLYRMMWRVHHDSRPRLMRAIEARRETTRVFHLRSPHELAEFCAQHCSR
jgi:adenylate kinase family enzyme